MQSTKNMAAVTDCFPIGSTVACTTCFNQEICGEVLAYDESTKMLILKCANQDSAKKNDVYILNINMCKDIQVTKETQLTPENPPSLDLKRLNMRVRNQVEQKKRLVTALTGGASRQGQRLFLAISKTISEVAWNGHNICVFNDVTIAPPYSVENVEGTPGTQQLTYVKKIVEMHTSNLNSTDMSGSVSGNGGGGGSGAGSSEETSPTPPTQNTF